MTNETNGNTHPRPKRPYEKPTVVAVALRPEEAVLGACKIGGQSAAGDNTCASLLCGTAGS